MKRELEALLFATDAPLTAARLKKIFPEADAKELKAAVAELQDEYDRGGHAFTVVEFGGGWQIASRPDYAPVIEQLLRTRRFARLSKAGLEVLAIVAYRQPITRLEIDEIRGVNSSGALATLTERSLITVVGRSQTVGNPLLYGTTREFLNHLGLKGLGQLPDLPAIETIIDDREQLKAFASRIGRDVSDDELDGFLAGDEDEDEDTQVIVDPADQDPAELDPAELDPAGETDPDEADGTDVPADGPADADDEDPAGDDAPPADREDDDEEDEAGHERT